MSAHGPDLSRMVSPHDIGKRYRLPVNTPEGFVEGVLGYDKTPTVLPARRGYALVLDGGYSVPLTPKDHLERVPVR